LTRIDLGGLLEEMRGILTASLPGKARLRLTTHSDAEIHGDATQIRQVIQSLVDNAADALHGRVGTVHLMCQVVDQDGTAAELQDVGEVPPPGRYAVLDVEDDGDGMTSEVLHRAFEPFFTSRKTGRGLGLAAVMGIVRGHGGTVTASSHVGHGSTFRVWLPHADAQLRSLTPLPAPQRRSGTTILVVDDELAMRTVCGRLLNRSGFDCLFASNGREAVETFAEHKFDVGLVLLDLSMPELDGNETLFLLREIDPHVPVILMSGWQDGALLVDPVHGAGASDFLHKPFPPQALLARVRHILKSDD
jgi:CheY-like chemotaxis protein